MFRPTEKNNNNNSNNKQNTKTKQTKNTKQTTKQKQKNKTKQKKPWRSQVCLGKKQVPYDTAIKLKMKESHSPKLQSNKFYKVFVNKKTF